MAFIWGVEYFKWCDSQLVKACKRGDVITAKCMIRDGANAYNDAMIAACENGFTDIARLMHENGAIVFQASLDAAAKNGHLETIRALIELGAIVRDETFYSAIVGGHIHIVEYLITINRVARIDYIHHAAKHNQHAIIHLLINRAAEEKMPLMPRQLNELLRSACKAKQKEAAHALIAHGAVDIFAWRSNHSDNVEILTSISIKMVLTILIVALYVVTIVTTR
jgi:hypothetical protein